MARGPLTELRDALDKFESATGGDHRYRHVKSSLRDVHSELDRLPDHLDEPADDVGEDRESGDAKSPKNFREARSRSRDRLAAEEDDELKTSSASAANGGAAQEDS